MKKCFSPWTFFFVILLFLAIPLVSAEHNITGFVKDALDGTGANGRIITLWNFSGGINNNLTDIIGLTGKSKLNNKYSIDCDLLIGGCNIGDVLTLQVINSGEDYPSPAKNVTVTGASYDAIENITLNSPPEANPIYPENYENISTTLINFNCSLNDLDNNLENVTLYGNWSQGWHTNETKSVTGNQNYVVFSKNLVQGVYKYGCKVFDSLSIKNYSENNSFTVDLTKPEISSVLINQSHTCGTNSRVRVNCTATDILLSIDKVIIQELSPSGTTNYSTIFLTGNTWYADILVDELGTWKFNCIVNDSAGNEQNLTSSELDGASSLPDLSINYNTIHLSNINPFENETIIINATIENLGCGEIVGGIIGFFDGNPALNGENLNNDTINLGSLEKTEASIIWKAQMGKHNFFVFADYWELIEEFNETNNYKNKTFSINSWQEIYGNFSINKTLGADKFNLSKWFNESSLGGNIFVTDSECNVDWTSLQAIGKTISGGDSSNDFSEIDSLLNMQNFEDSVSKKFSNSQIPKQKDFFMIHQKNITDVPTINSTSDKTFVTGILWDYSDDVDSDNEYDSNDKEDLLFVTKINKGKAGDYGIYDYELEIPARLREYKTEDSGQVYLYYDLN